MTTKICNENLLICILRKYNIGVSILFIFYELQLLFYYLLHDAGKGQMTGGKRVGRRITQFLDDLENRRRYWELNEELKIENDGNRQFINRT